MTFDPPVTCPVCEETLELDRQLETHLIANHTQREIARYVISQQDGGEIAPLTIERS